MNEVLLFKAAKAGKCWGHQLTLNFESCNGRGLDRKAVSIGSMSRVELGLTDPVGLGALALLHLVLGQGHFDRGVQIAFLVGLGQVAVGTAGGFGAG